MANWTRDELDTIGAADELQIVTVRGDGTKRKPVTIWVVRVGDDLYVRSGYGDRAAWYRGTQSRRDGHITAGGGGKDVRFEEAALMVLATSSLEIAANSESTSKSESSFESSSR